MRTVPDSKKMKAFILDEEFMGGGLYIIKCPHQAMHLELVRPPEHTPTHSYLVSRSSALTPPPAQM
jgi:hypothetical protein